MQFTRKALRPSSSVFKDGREIKRDAVRIGIQIRAGNWTFNDEEKKQVELEPYMPFFNCARQIEEFAKPHTDSQVLWYVISDSDEVRKKALAKFGPKLLVTLTREAKHVACNVVDCGDRNQTQALVEAVGDIMSLSKTEFKVLTQKSGFGKVAASVAIDQWHNVYWPGKDNCLGLGARIYKLRSTILCASGLTLQIFQSARVLGTMLWNPARSSRRSATAPMPTTSSLRT
jgi:hypothetical protein